MKKNNLSWVGALLVFGLLLWCTSATPGKIADPSTYTCAVYSTALSLLPPVVAIVLALNTKEVYTSLLVGIATGALLYANGNLELALTTLFFNEDGGMVAKLSDSSNVGILVFLVMLGILVALMNKAGGSAAFGRWASTKIMIPSSRVANCAPARVWIWVEAHRPKAALPPALFIRATRMPSMTRKTRIPTLLLSDSLDTMPPSSLKNRVVRASSRLPLA